MTFAPSPPSKRFCGPTCRTRASREAKAAEQSVGADARKGRKPHELVAATEKDLRAWEQYDSVSGQLALQFARRLTDPNEPALSGLSKEFRSLMSECKEAGTRPADPAAGSDPAPGAEPAAKLTPLDEMRAKREAEQEARTEEG